MKSKVLVDPAEAFDPCGLPKETRLESNFCPLVGSSQRESMKRRWNHNTRIYVGIKIYSVRKEDTHAQEHKNLD